MAEFNFRYLCTPAKIYFAIAVIASVFALLNGAALMAIFMKLVFAFAWTFFLGWLCKKGMKTLSWFLVLLPYIIMGLAMFGIYRVSHEQKQVMRTLQMQGAFGQEPMTPMSNMSQKKDGMAMSSA